MTELKAKGSYTFELVRKGEVIDRWTEDNIIVNQGLDYILGVAFAGVSQITQWFLGLFAGNYSPVGTDTAQTFPANATESTAYGQVRASFTVTEANQSANNTASPALFTFTASATIYGAFLISSQAVGSTQGVLASAVVFSTARSVIANDQLSIQYGCAASSA